MAEGEGPERGKRIESISVGDFFNRHGKDLRMRLMGDESGFSRKIREPTINRPGLALAGFYSYFAFMRIQVIGKAERSYLKSLDHEDRRRRLRISANETSPASSSAGEIPCLQNRSRQPITRGFPCFAPPW